MKIKNHAFDGPSVKPSTQSAVSLTSVATAMVRGKVDTAIPGPYAAWLAVPGVDDPRENRTLLLHPLLPPRASARDCGVSRVLARERRRQRIEHRHLPREYVQ